MDSLQQNISLRPYNTFAIDATAPLFATFSDSVELLAIVKECKSRELPFYVLGGGSNIIFTGNFKGLIIHPISENVTVEGDLVIAEAGLEWDKLVGWCVERNLAGLENLSYIPGTVGASPVQNIGAYGAEAGSMIEWVEFLNCDTLELQQIEGSLCEFGYRESIFKKSLRGKAIITRVAYRLNPNFTPSEAKLNYGDLSSLVESMSGGAELKNIRAAVTTIRKTKLPEPSELGNAGSFFKNPIVTLAKFEALKESYPNIPSYVVDSDSVKIPAGWLIDTAQWRGFRDGAVGVHTNQALVLVNYGGATANDILDLASRIIDDIALKFGITISMEVNVL